MPPAAVVTQPLPQPAPVIVQPATPGPVPSPAPMPGPATVTGGAPIALVLPLNSPTYGHAAEAVRAGFVAAAEAAGVRYVVVGHTDGAVVTAIAKAREAGARLIRGRLCATTRTVATSRIDLPWMIALNQLDDGTPLPASVYTWRSRSKATLCNSPARARRRRGGPSPLSAATPVAETVATARRRMDQAGRWTTGDVALDRAPDMLALLHREIARRLSTPRCSRSMHRMRRS
jgi:hypothetical protein